ncbi:uncharacterized protein PV09_00892 [Verruconis gallopava]|uniref:DNA-directed RNA polymerase subunit n=1 Tax=Verruconis gallopava TaxID=253628 RepID=A0A0D2BCB9_9PEZI|nr:uncharacterized protein PV09_00892 [Verruconis gallopava]KIW08994.1 hypothetical protein PV09_00892 [Verruconis gallopava]
MSTATATPLSHKKTKSKVKESKHSNATPEERDRANQFSEQLLSGSRTAHLNGDTISKNGKPSKKRQREELTPDGERVASPSKKQRNSITDAEASTEAFLAEKLNGDMAHESLSKSRRRSHGVSGREAETSQLVEGSRSQSGNAQELPLSRKVPGLPAELESPFVTTTASFKVTIPPVAQLYPLEGALAHYISPLLLTWHPQLDGIILAYNNAKLHTCPPLARTIKDEEDQPMAQAIDECAAPYIWLTLDALVFQPKKGLELEGYLNLQNESHITLILWNFFTVTIDYKHLPKSWVWQEYYEENGKLIADREVAEGGDKPMRRSDEQWGAWYDGQGNAISGLLRFRIRDWDCAPPGANGEGSFLSLSGSMLTIDEERQLEACMKEENRLRREASAGPRARTPLASAMKGGTSGRAGR